MSNRIHVAVGVIYNSNKNKVLITKRTAGQHLEGLWEFPGGKVEKDEDILSALNRELFEELGIVVKAAKQLTVISHDYPDKKVLLDVWEIYDWTGEPEAKEKQKIEWSGINELNKYDFPEANKHIIQTLSLSPLYLISQDTYQNYNKLFSVVDECLSAGLKIFQLRLASRSEPEFSSLINNLNKLTKQHEAKLIINGTPSDLDLYEIDGVHLNSNELKKYKRRPVSEEYILGASCHTEEELAQAQKLNVNYAFLSPVQKTSSHPDEVPIGWNTFYQLSKKVKFPLYALGGLKSSDLSVAIENNAFGIAMINSIWNSSDPAKEILSL